MPWVLPVESSSPRSTQEYPALLRFCCCTWQNLGAYRKQGSKSLNKTWKLRCWRPMYRPIRSTCWFAQTKHTAGGALHEIPRADIDLKPKWLKVNKSAISARDKKTSTNRQLGHNLPPYVPNKGWNIKVTMDGPGFFLCVDRGRSYLKKKANFEINLGGLQL